jgi:hypothetical protein
LLVRATPIAIVEPQANLIGIVDFDNVDDRGWPCEVDSAQLVTTHPASSRRFRQ